MSRPHLSMFGQEQNSCLFSFQTRSRNVFLIIHKDNARRRRIVV